MRERHIKHQQHKGSLVLKWLRQHDISNYKAFKFLGMHPDTFRKKCLKPHSFTLDEIIKLAYLFGRDANELIKALLLMSPTIHGDKVEELVKLEPRQPIAEDLPVMVRPAPEQSNSLI